MGWDEEGHVQYVMNVFIDKGAKLDSASAVFDASAIIST